MIKDIWKDPVWSKVIAAVIIALLGSLAAYFGLLSWITSSTLVPNWLIGLMIISCTFFAYKMFEKSDTSTDWEKSYQNDNFFGLRWTWKYSKKKIVNLSSHCSECNYRIIHRDDPIINCVCEECGHEVKNLEISCDELSRRVKFKIEKEIRNGTWT